MRRRALSASWCAVAWTLAASGALHCQPTAPAAPMAPPGPVSADTTLPPTPPAASSAPTPASAPSASSSASFRAMPTRPVCDRIELGMCTGAARFLAACDEHMVNTTLVPELVRPLGLCLAEHTADDASCGNTLRTCVHDTVLAVAQPTDADAQQCAGLQRACTRAGRKADYTTEQCAHVLAASQPGEPRQQAVKALGPSSPEPRPCTIAFIWPSMPFTPYFPAPGGR